MADLARKEKNDFGDESFSDGDLDIVAGATSLQSRAFSPETPRKAIKTSAVATPGSKRKWEDANGGKNALPTPSTRGGGDIFTTTPTSMGKAKLKGGIRDASELSGMRSPAETPTPRRFRDATSGIDPRKEENYDITDSVLDILKDSKLEEEIQDSLKTLLNRHALKISGIAKGRDITRVALKAKETKIAELQQRITQLETEREMDKIVIRHFKKDMAESVTNVGNEKRRGSGG